jgi:hypothetical protein
MAASWIQPRQEMAEPRGARTRREPGRAMAKKVIRKRGGDEVMLGDDVRR